MKNIKKEIVNEFIHFYKERGMDNKTLAAAAEEVFQNYEKDLLQECFASHFQEMQEEQIEISFLPAEQMETRDKNEEVVLIEMPKRYLLNIPIGDRNKCVIEAFKEYYGIKD
ncbi:hypothetical protein [Emergencia sp. 1XD21-10]|uniref:hypothetical protein n=1 Tax=Emergencia sp. 1XD21-10 TaxID=2304569 RepID=UPI00137B213F|nr:hypothetical protein [Emergencia sp. 1XD21-10]NCE98094.1 hypothetical protein [Emergencia sp. 1XD21-10]